MTNKKSVRLTKLFWGVRGWGGPIIVTHKMELIKFENVLYQTLYRITNSPYPVIYNFIRKEQLLKIQNIVTKIYTAGQWQKPQPPKDARTQAQSYLQGPPFSCIEYYYKRQSPTNLHFRLLYASMFHQQLPPLCWSLAFSETNFHQFHLLYSSNINHCHNWGQINQ